MRILHAQVMAGVAGSEMVLRALLPEQVRRGYEVHFACIHRRSDAAVCRRYCEELAASGVVTHRVEFNRHPSIGLLRQLDQVALLRPFHLVHTHLLKADALFAAARVLFRRSYTLVSTKHGYHDDFVAAHGFESDKNPRDAYWLIAKWAETQVSASSAVSAGVAQLMVGLGIVPPGRIHITRLGFDLPYERVERTELRFGSPQLCVVGRLVEYKGQAVAIRVLRAVLSEFPNAALVLVGAGPFEPSLRSLAGELNVADRVHFVGRRENPRDYFAASDVALVPSKSEGFGLVTLEAMSVGVPVVAFDVPAFNEVIEHAVSGLLACPESLEDYTECVRSLLRSPERRQRLVENASMRLESEFSLQAMADGFDAFYRAVHA